MYLESLNVLLVDDEAQIRELIAKNLKKRCNNVFIAANGKEALEIFDKNGIDLIVSDIRMPVLDGIELLKAVKSIDREQVTVLFSGSNDTEFLIEAINLGCDKFFTKPIDFAKFLQELELLAKKITAQKQNSHYKKLLRQKWQIDHRDYKDLINEFEQYLELIDATNCIRKYDNDGKIVYINQKLKHKLGHDGKMDEAFGQSCMHGKKFNITKLNDYIQSQGTFKDIIRHQLDSQDIYLDSAITKLKDANGEDRGFLEIGYDISKIYALNQELDKLSDDVIYLLGSVAESRSIDTALHLERVTRYATLLANHTDMNDAQKLLLKRATPLHDIGKIAIPNRILQKPGKLTDEEFERIKEHTTIGHNILCSVDNEIFSTAATIALTHHEKWDGSGYPLGLKKDEIDFMGRIVAIVDVFDALTSKRSYKDEWSIDRAIEIIKPQREKQFDPLIYDLFFQHLDQIVALKQKTEANF
jgi:response regulator RpfG family c-di-GMP phosphodiesterase